MNKIIFVLPLIAAIAIPTAFADELSIPYSSENLITEIENPSLLVIQHGNGVVEYQYSLM